MGLVDAVCGEGGVAGDVGGGEDRGRGITSGGVGDPVGAELGRGLVVDMWWWGGVGR